MNYRKGIIMLQTITSGYIKKDKKLNNNANITQEIAKYKGKLKVNNKEIVVELYSKDKNFTDKELFIKISKETTDKIYGIL